VLFKRFLVAFTLLAAFLPAALFAHGGGTPVLTRVEAGPYWLYVFTEPAMPQAGAEYHVTVAVTQPQADGSEEPVNNASVAVRFVPESGDAILKEADSSVAGPGYYEADLVFPGGGTWQVHVDVISPLGSGSAAYEVEALAAAGLPWSWVAGGVIVVLAGAGLLAFAVGKRGKRTAAGASSVTKRKKQLPKEAA
jgi:hypothetical protein